LRSTTELKLLHASLLTEEGALHCAKRFLELLSTREALRVARSVIVRSLFHSLLHYTRKALRERVRGIHAPIGQASFSLLHSA